MAIVIGLQAEQCTSCSGSGRYLYSGMGPADNMDVWEEWDICYSCDGSGYEGADYVEVIE